MTLRFAFELALDRVKPRTKVPAGRCREAESAERGEAAPLAHRTRRDSHSETLAPLLPVVVAVLELPRPKL
jgi:hypothetical protein